MNNEDKMNALKKQIDEKRYGLFVESYKMSLLELIGLYESNDIDLKAEYQRNYKWSDKQKSRFIESLFLGLPIPAIFLYQDEDALWEVVDGIQRLSTIYQFYGVLKKDESNFFEPLKLVDVPELTHLNDLTFKDFANDLQREFKKLRLDLVIISKKTDADVKLEIFRRLNGFGTVLNPQELRNSLIILTDSSYFDFISNLSNSDEFLKTIGLEIDDDKYKNKKHYEYIIRYLILIEETYLLDSSSPNKSDMNLFFDEAIIHIIKNKKINMSHESDIFYKTFIFLNEQLGNNAFKKFYFDDKNTTDVNSSGEFKLAIRESIFEAIVPVLSRNIDFYIDNPEIFNSQLKSLYLKDSIFEEQLETNPGTITRMQRMITVSKEIFNVTI